MIEKTASVHWVGAGKKGQGQISTETGALKSYPYGFALTMIAAVPGIDEARFQEIALAAKRDCPLSTALASVPQITLQATLLATTERGPA